MNLPWIPTIGYSYGNASRNKNACQGPLVVEKQLTKSLHLKWQTILSSNHNEKTGMQALDSVAILSKELATAITACINKYNMFLMIGGDHSSAIGTWNGAANTLTNDLGLLWIDAHLDCHTPKSSHTKNIHGMPVATLLGYGEKKLTKLTKKTPILKPHNIKMIGMNDYEPEEIELLKKLNVDITFLNQLKNNDPYSTIINYGHMLNQQTEKFGISLDLDAFSPKKAPGVTTVANGGIDISKTISAIKTLAKLPNFIGLEIAEFTPCNDIHNKTLSIIENIIQAVFLED